MSGTTENTRYREAAEYDTTVEAAIKATSLITPADCLAYELRQYMTVYSDQIFSAYGPDEVPENLDHNHPDYPHRLAEYHERSEHDLSRAYELCRKELADEWASAQAQNPPDERLLLALVLKQSAQRLVNTRDYLAYVGSGLSPANSKPYRALFPYATTEGNGPYKGIIAQFIAAGKTAAEIEHFHLLLSAFHEAEQSTPFASHYVPAINEPTVPLPALPIDFALYIKQEHRNRLLPFLRERYTDQKPQAVACMLIALQDLTALTIPLKDNETALHNALSAFLGNVGTRQALNRNLSNLRSASNKENLNIEAHRARIKLHMEQA